VFLQGVSIACYASPVLAIVGMSVRPSVRLSVCHTLALSENDASYYIVLFIPCRLSNPVTPKYMTLNDLEGLNGHFTLNSVFAPIWLAENNRKIIA